MVIHTVGEDKYGYQRNLFLGQEWKELAQDRVKW
jgi:hypothetical protein